MRRLRLRPDLHSPEHQRARLSGVRNGFSGEEMKKVSYRIAGRAHAIVAKAIKDGELTPQSCEVCGAQKTQAHHEDYSKPFDVNWLCTKHHGERHRNRPAKTTARAGDSMSYPLKLSSELLEAGYARAIRENRTLASLIRHAIACYLADKAAEAGKAVSA